MTKFIFNSLLYMVLCCSFQCLYAQEWAWSKAIYQNNTIMKYRATALDANDNLVIVFNAKDSTRIDNKKFVLPNYFSFVMCKHNEKGDLLWFKEKICYTANNQGNITLLGLKTDSKGNHYMVGHVNDAQEGVYFGSQLVRINGSDGRTVPNYSFIAKYNSNGEYVAIQTFRNTQLSSMTIDKDDNIIFSAKTSRATIQPPIWINTIQYNNLFPQNTFGTFLGKLDSQGNVLATKVLYYYPINWAESLYLNLYQVTLQTDQENNMIVMSEFTREVSFLGQLYKAKPLSANLPWSTDIIMAKMSANFDKIWTKHIASSRQDNIRAFFVDTQNNIYWSASNSNNSSLPDEAMQVESQNLGATYVAKMNGKGELEWVKDIEKQYHIQTITQTKAGKILFGGYFSVFVQTIQLGTIQLNRIQLPPDKIDEYHGVENYFIAQLKPNGVYEWGKNWVHQGGLIDIYLTPTQRGDIYVSSSFRIRAKLEEKFFVATPTEDNNFLVSKIELCPQDISIQKIEESRCNTVTLQSSPCKDCTYEWLYENKVVGTAPNYTATQAGKYELVAKKQYCTVTTNTTVNFPVLDVQFTVREGVAKTDSILLFPNPTTDEIQLKFLASPPIALETQSATKWTSVRWYHNGVLLPQWDNKMTICPTLAGVYEFVGTDEKGCILRRNTPEIPRNHEQKVVFMLYDSIGRKLVESSTQYLDLAQTFRLNMGVYGAGLYLLVLQTDKAEQQCYKVVKL